MCFPDGSHYFLSTTLHVDCRGDFVIVASVRKLDATKLDAGGAPLILLQFSPLANSQFLCHPRFWQNCFYLNVILSFEKYELCSVVPDFSFNCPGDIISSWLYHSIRVFFTKR